MRGKILIVTGLAVGYVLGARAGRERYEQIKRVTAKFWNDPRVQHQVDRVEDFAKDKAPEVVDFLSDNAKKVVAQVKSSKKKDAPAAKASTTKASATKTTATKPSARKKTSGTASASK